MSDSSFYSYENNVQLKHLNDSNPNCVCSVEQYMNIQRAFPPPETVARLGKSLGGMVQRMDTFLDRKKILKNLFKGPKRVKVELKNSSFRARHGALHYMNGKIELEVTGSVLKSSKSVFPVYTGTGTVFLEPVSADVNLMFVNVDGVVYVDKDLFVACEGTLTSTTVWVKGLATKLFGGEGMRENKFEGKGWLLIRIPVPISEIQKMELKKDGVLTVDGNFAMMRRGEIEFSVGLMGSGLSKLFNKTGEGLVLKYVGEGTVWLCPTWRERNEGILY